MKVLAAVLVQTFLLAIALSVTALRCFVRLKIEGRALTLSDYLIWAGWLCTLAWVTCQCSALYIELDHPLNDDMYSDSVDYLKTVFISCYFFDLGLFFPKASIVAFYWWLIPVVFRRMRIALYISTIYLGAAILAAFLTDTLITWPISDNWSIENQANSVWNSYTDLAIIWGLNISTDLLVFCFPFFILKSLKLRQRQTIGLIGVFSLGLVTIAISVGRFIAYSITDYDLSDTDGAVWCTAEMCTAVIVASLPGLRVLITGSTSPRNTENRSSVGYVRTISGQPDDRCQNIQRRSDPFHDDDSKRELVSMRSLSVSHRKRSTTGQDVVGPGVMVERGFIVASDKV